MLPDIPEDLSESLNDLARLTLDQGGLEDLMSRVAHSAVRVMPGCDSAGVSLVSNEKVTTAAATDSTVVEADQAQYQTGQGPCLQAIRDDAVYLITSMDEEERFPDWTQKAKAAGVNSSLSLPLNVNGETTGALNLYSWHEDGFSEKDQPAGSMLASQAAVSLLNAQIYQRAVDVSEQLKDALESRTMIGQAVGLLMQRESVTDAAAFEMLKTASQASNQKLRTIAQTLVEGHHTSLN